MFRRYCKYWLDCNDSVVNCQRLSTVYFSRLADRAAAKYTIDARWSLSLAAELIDLRPRYLCSECTGLITVGLQWSFNCSLVQGIEFGARHYTKMVWPIMRNCKLLNLFLRQGVYQLMLIRDGLHRHRGCQSTRTQYQLVPKSTRTQRHSKEK